MKSFIIFYTALFLMSCSYSNEVAIKKYVSPSELNKHPDKYDGLDIYVKGYVLLGTNARSLFESKKRYEEYRNAWERDSESGLDKFNYDCITLTEANLMVENQDFFNGKTIVVHGVFEKNSLNKFTIDLQACSDTAIRLKNDDIRIMLNEKK